MKNEFCVVLSTVGDEVNMQTIIDAALKQRLAACIQTFPISSHYVWKGEVCAEKEFLMVIKTMKRHYLELQQLIIDLHEYETPQIVQVPVVDGFHPYLAWLQESTRPHTHGNTLLAVFLVKHTITRLYFPTHTQTYATIHLFPSTHALTHFLYKHTQTRAYSFAHTRKHTLPYTSCFLFYFFLFP